MKLRNTLLLAVSFITLQSLAGLSVTTNRLGALNSKSNVVMSVSMIEEDPCASNIANAAIAAAGCVTTNEWGELLLQDTTGAMAGELGSIQFGTFGSVFGYGDPMEEYSGRLKVNSAWTQHSTETLAFISDIPTDYIPAAGDTNSVSAILAAARTDAEDAINIYDETKKIKSVYSYDENSYVTNITDIYTTRYIYKAGGYFHGYNAKHPDWDPVFYYKGYDTTSYTNACYIWTNKTHSAAQIVYIPLNGEVHCVTTPDTLSTNTLISTVRKRINPLTTEIPTVHNKYMAYNHLLRYAYEKSDELAKKSWVNARKLDWNDITNKPEIATRSMHQLFGNSTNYWQDAYGGVYEVSAVTATNISEIITNGYNNVNNVFRHTSNSNEWRSVGSFASMPYSYINWTSNGKWNLYDEERYKVESTSASRDATSFTLSIFGTFYRIFETNIVTTVLTQKINQIVYTSDKKQNQLVEVENESLYDVFSLSVTKGYEISSLWNVERDSTGVVTKININALDNSIVLAKNNGWSHTVTLSNSSDTVKFKYLDQNATMAWYVYDKIVASDLRYVSLTSTNRMCDVSENVLHTSISASTTNVVSAYGINKDLNDLKSELITYGDSKYVTSAAIYDMATKTWVTEKNYVDSPTAQSIADTRIFENCCISTNVNGEIECEQLIINGTEFYAFEDYSSIYTDYILFNDGVEKYKDGIFYAFKGSTFLVGPAGELITWYLPWDNDWMTYPNLSLATGDQVLGVIKTNAYGSITYDLKFGELADSEFILNSNGLSYTNESDTVSSTLSVYAPPGESPRWCVNYMDSTRYIAYEDMISPDNSTFSNAVISVGLGLGTNEVAQINAILEDMGKGELGEPVTVGSLLLALAAAIAWLKKKTKEIEDKLDTANGYLAEALGPDSSDSSDSSYSL